MGHLNFWTANKSSTIPLGYKLGCIICLNRMRNLTMHRDSWRYLLILVNWMFLFLYVGWNMLVLKMLTPCSTFNSCAMISLSCVRYGRMGKSGRSGTPLKIFIKNI